MQKLVDLNLVTQILQLSQNTLSNWGGSGALSIVRIHGMRYCCEDEIDKLLKEGAPDPQTALTWNAIIAQGIKFLTQSEAQTRLKVSQSEVSRLGQEGILSLVHFGRTVRYTEQSVEAIVQPEERQRKKQGLKTSRAAVELSDDLLTYKQTAHVLGVGVSIVPNLVSSKRLISTRVGGRSYITRGSLITLLVSLLPAWIDPTVWMNGRLASNNALVYQKALRASWGDYLMIPDILVQGEVEYIRHATSGLPLLSQESYLAYLERNEPETTITMYGKLYGVSRQTIHHWDNQHPGWRACNMHPHTDHKTYRSCTLKILERSLNLSAGGSAWGWYEGRETYNVPAIDEQTALKFCNTDKATLMKTVKALKIVYLVTPNGDLRFSASTIVKVARKCWAAQSE